MFTLRKQNNPCGFLDSVGSLQWRIDHMTTQKSAPDTTNHPDTGNPATQYVPTWAVFASIGVSIGLAFTTVGVVSDWGGMRTKPIGFFVRYAQGTARLLPLPSTAEARGGCQALGGVPTWSPAGLTVFTMHGGNCSYMKPLEASYLYASHDGSTVEHSFPGRELPDPIRR